VRTPDFAASASAKVVIYNPFTPSGTLDSRFKVVAVKNALNPGCLSSGVAGGSSFRCFTNPDIYDPCFAPRGATKGPVYCPVLLPRDVVEIRTGKLPSLLKGQPYRPWALELSDGKVCVLVDAAWGGLGPFGCNAPVGVVADCRIPTSSEGRWTTRCQKREDPESPFTAYRIVTVWK
jgi:hypothetical protein